MSSYAGTISDQVDAMKDTFRPKTGKKAKKKRGKGKRPFPFKK